MEMDSRVLSHFTPSQLAATVSVQRWTGLHDYRQFRDSSQFIWEIKKTMYQKQLPEDPKQLRWSLSIQLWASVKKELLLETGTLHPQRDQRLLTLLGSYSIPFHMRPIFFEGNSEKEAVRKCETSFPELKRKIEANDFHALKRNVINSWVEQLSRFDKRQLAGLL
jgi:hypothetical protein